jgi:murein DD-endopeptidase MepM/ murein hydrolase activator NlpD
MSNAIVPQIKWLKPIPLTIVLEKDFEGFRRHPTGTTGLPIGDTHAGAFGYPRRHHIHEGIDLYCPEGTSVVAVETGIVVAVIDFTGPLAQPPSPWWHKTMAVLVEGDSGVVVYGEIAVEPSILEGAHVKAGDPIGHVVSVLKKVKNDRPTAMLHLELHEPGTRDAYEWTIALGRPASLRDPTPFLMEAIDASK